MIDTEVSTADASPKTFYRKCRTTAQVGDSIEIPGNAEAITIADLSPFGETVQVSWLQPVDGDDKGATNLGVLRSCRTYYADDDPLDLPNWAWAVTVYEPPESDETVVYYLE